MCVKENNNHVSSEWSPFKHWSIRSLSTLCVFLCYAIISFPLALVIVPGLYADLVRTYLERDLKAFIKENGLEEKEEEEEEEAEEEEEDLSMADLEKDLKKEGKKR